MAEDYEKRVKKILEGPPKHYTGFVSDLDVGLKKLQEKLKPISV
jgi:hypothetical protein